MDEYLDGLTDGRNAVYPPDSHTWRPVKPTKQQQSLIQDSVVADMVRMRLIQEARQAEIDAGMGGGYDAGAVNVNPVQNYNINTEGATVLLPGNAEQFNFVVDSSVTTFNLNIQGFGSFSLFNNYDVNNYNNCYLSAYNLNNISISYNPVYVTASETLSSNGQYFTIFYINTGSVLLSIFKSNTLEPQPTPTPTPSPTPSPTPTSTSTPVPPTPTPSPTPTPTPDPYSYAYDYETGALVASILGNIPNEWMFNRTDIGAVTIGASVSSIGDFGFNTTSISNIIIPDNVTSLGAECFRYCSYMSSVVLSNNITQWGINAFEFCAISEIVIPNGLRDIGPGAFSNNPIQNLTLGTGVTAIGAGAFFSNTNLTTLVVPDQVKIIAGGAAVYNGAFSYCALSNLVWGSGVTHIGSYAFNQNALTYLELPNGLQTIDADAFTENQLTAVIIPNSVISIESSVFRDNTNLASVSCFNAYTSFVGSNAFYNTADPLTIHARTADGTWTAGAGQEIQGNANVTVIKDLN